jgi:hypothetical protein
MTIKPTLTDRALDAAFARYAERVSAEGLQAQIMADVEATEQVRRPYFALPGWLARPVAPGRLAAVPTVAWVLLLTGLLLGFVVGGLAGGVWRGPDQSLLVVSSPTPLVERSPSVEPSPSPSLPAPTSIASSCVVSTLAGKAGEPGAVDGTGAAARFSDKAGFLAWDADGGVLYLADGGNHAIRRITPEGVVTTVLGKPGEAGNVDGIGTAARFDTPVGIGVFGGQMWVADSGNGAVRMVDLASGTVTTVADGLDTPWGIAIRVGWSSTMVVYVSELDGYRIYSLPNGGQGPLGFTLGMNTVDDGWGTGGWGWPFGMAQAPEIVSSQIAYIVDVNADRSASALRRFDRTSQRVTTLPFDETFGRAGVPWLDATNSLYLTTFLDGTVVRRDWYGRTTLLAGKRGEEGSTDGSGDVARFVSPMGITGDGAGTLYVADPGSSTIRTIRCP